MLPLRVSQNASRIDALLAIFDQSVYNVDPKVQNIFANHVVLAGAGYIEDGVAAILADYSRLHGNNRIARFVEKSVARNHSLNCEKIESILQQFDKDWWSELENQTALENILAVDSLKTLRDQIAHGKPNGTGYITVKNYYERSKRFLADLAAVVTR